MKQFWKWMIERGYAKYSDIQRNYYLICSKYCIGHKPTKQMLIGYMFEYAITQLKAERTVDSIYKDLLFEIKAVAKSKK